MAGGIENEFKYVLRDWAEAERALMAEPGLQVIEMEAGYLSRQARIRSEAATGGTARVFTFKQPLPDGSFVEIPADLDADTFAQLWGSTVERLRKRRYEIDLPGSGKWAADFFRDDEGETYFAMAEVEVAAGAGRPEEVWPAIRRFVCFEPDRLAGDEFSSRRLADKEHAAAMAAKAGACP